MMNLIKKEINKNILNKKSLFKKRRRNNREKERN
jgi:hypothetical protein